MYLTTAVDQAKEPNVRTTIGWTISRHAKARATMRGTTIRAILETIAAPEISYPSGDHTVLVRGSLAIVTDERNQAVITVLLHSDEAWDDSEARAVLAAAS